jgi:ABC-type lipoprotein export system ATPase subunit
VLALLRELAADTRPTSPSRLRRPAQASGSTGRRAVVLVTHEANAAAIADRVLRLEHGRLVAA